MNTRTGWAAAGLLSLVLSLAWSSSAWGLSRQLEWWTPATDEAIMSWAAGPWVVAESRSPLDGVADPDNGQSDIYVRRADGVGGWRSLTKQASGGVEVRAVSDYHTSVLLMTAGSVGAAGDDNDNGKKDLFRVPIAGAGGPELLSPGTAGELYWNDVSEFSADGTRVFYWTSEDLGGKDDDVDDYDVFEYSVAGGWRLRTPGVDGSAFLRDVSSSGEWVFFIADGVCGPGDDDDDDIFRHAVNMVSSQCMTSGSGQDTQFGAGLDDGRVIYSSHEQTWPVNSEADGNRRDLFIAPSAAAGAQLTPGTDAFVDLSAVSGDQSRAFITSPGSFGLLDDVDSDKDDVFTVSLKNGARAVVSRFTSDNAYLAAVSPDGGRAVIATRGHAAGHDDGADTAPGQGDLFLYPTVPPGNGTLVTPGTPTEVGSDSEGGYVADAEFAPDGVTPIITTNVSVAGALDSADDGKATSAHDVYRFSGGKLELLTPGTRSWAVLVTAVGDARRIVFATPGSVKGFGPEDDAGARDLFVSDLREDPHGCVSVLVGCPLPPDARPASKIKPLRARVRRNRQPRKIRGTASDERGVKIVDISITTRRGKRCLAVRSSGRLRRYKATARHCSPRFTLRAKGTTKWVVRLRRKLPAGAYRITSRATDTAGQRETAFSTKRRNVRRLRIMK